ncbi:hypothetical protein Tco_0851029 [Tanacetum coccineum]
MDPYEFKVPQSPKQAPPSPDYMPGPEYPEYFSPSNDEISVEDQPLPADASPTALSLGYVADSDPLEEESSKNDNEEEEKAFEEDEDKEEEHIASANSDLLPAIDFVPSAEEMKPFETDESAATPPRDLILSQPHPPPLAYCTKYPLTRSI